MPERRKAYRVRLDDTEMITFAASPQQAKWNAVSGWREAWGKKEWPKSLQVKRSPGYDGSPDDKGVRECITEEYVRRATCQ